MEHEFTQLENKTIGRNIYLFRKIRDKKAEEVAEHLGVSKSTFTKIERGETAITIPVIQQISEFLRVDPLQIITSQPGHTVDNIHNSPNAQIGVGNYIGVDFKCVDERVLQSLDTLTTSLAELNKTLIKMVEKEK